MKPALHFFACVGFAACAAVLCSAGCDGGSRTGGDGDEEDAVVDPRVDDWSVDDGLAGDVPLDETSDAPGFDAADAVEEQDVDPGPMGPVEISGESCAGIYPRVAAAPGGAVMVIWECDSLPIHYACFDGTSWTEPAPVSESTGTEDVPWLAVGGDGTFHAVWCHGTGTNRQIHYASFSGPCGGSWSGVEVVSADDSYPYSSVFPAVGVDESNVPYVSWSQSVVPTITRACDAGNPCPDQYTCYDGSCKPFVYEQHFSRRLGGAWETPMVIKADPAALCHHGTLHVVGSSEVHAVYHFRNGGRNVYHSWFDGDAWSESSDTGINSHAAGVAADAETIHVFGNTSHYAWKSKSGGAWSSERIGSGGDFSLVALRLGPDGSLHTAWTDGGGEGYRILYAEKPAGEAWRGPVRVSDDLPRFHEPSLDTGPGGYVHIVWTECRADGCPGTGHQDHGAIWYMRTTYEDI